jgi:hypothetical protein
MDRIQQIALVGNQNTLLRGGTAFRGGTADDVAEGLCCQLRNWLRYGLCELDCSLSALKIQILLQRLRHTKLSSKTQYREHGMVEKLERQARKAL